MHMKVSKNKAEDSLIVEVPIEKARLSGSEKTWVIASSHGVKRTNVFHDGKEIAVTLNAFIYPDENDTQMKRKKQRKTQG